MRMRMGSRVWLFLVVALLVGCVGTLGTPVFVSPLSPSAVPRATLSLQPDAVATPVPDVEPAVAQAVADLAARLGVDAGIVGVVRVSVDEFPIQNLGCPFPKGKEPEPVQPAFVTGCEIVLAVGDQKRYTYRARGDLLIFCGEEP